MAVNSVRCCMVIGLFAVNTAGYAVERTITLRDWTGRGFAPEVVGYEVPAAGAEKLRVVSVDYAGEKISVRFSPDSPVSPQRLVEVVSKSAGAVLTPEGVVRLRVGPAEEGRIEGVRALLKALLCCARVCCKGRLPRALAGV